MIIQFHDVIVEMQSLLTQMGDNSIMARALQGARSLGSSSEDSCESDTPCNMEGMDSNGNWNIEMADNSIV